MFGFWKKKTAEIEKPKRTRISRKQLAVYRQIKELGVCNARKVEDFMGWRGGSVTPRISELVKKELVKVAYIKKGVDGRSVRYYRVTNKRLSI